MAGRGRNPVDILVGRNIRIHRLDQGLSQTELGKQIGVTFQQVQKYENGVNRISMGRLTRIGRLLNVDITYLLGAPHQKLAAATDPRERARTSESMRMLGRIGALRMLRAFAAIPTKPPTLRESIVEMVEGIASAAPRKPKRK